MAVFSGGGVGGYVLKEKLKIIKLSLCEWHHKYAHNIQGKITNVKERIAVLDEKD